jgi:polysaccharide export outer membrane protein
VKGLNAVQAAAAISERLKTAQVMIDPHVSVFVDEYATQGITILGEVRTPGTYTLYGPHSVYDLLAAAGGPSTAEGDTINITHHGDADHPLLIPVHSPNYSELLKTTMVVPGDMVVISRAPLYYVIGDVGHPGAYYINNGDTVTLLNAIALASGVNRTAAYSKATIIRKTPDGTVKIPLDIKQVLENKGSNVTLQAQDVLVVPHSGFKTFLDTALPAITNAGISAGASAAIIR